MKNEGDRSSLSDKPTPTNTGTAKDSDYPSFAHVLDVRRPVRRALVLLLLLACAGLSWLILRERSIPRGDHVNTVLETPETTAGTEAPFPLDFSTRHESNRFVEGTKPTLLKNARIWIGDNDGKDVIRGDVLMDRGMIKRIGNVTQEDIDGLNLEVFDLNGHWVTPGLIDLFWQWEERESDKGGTLALIGPSHRTAFPIGHCWRGWCGLQKPYDMASTTSALAFKGQKGIFIKTRPEPPAFDKSGLEHAAQKDPIALLSIDAPIFLDRGNGFNLTWAYWKSQLDSPTPPASSSSDFVGSLFTGPARPADAQGFKLVAETETVDEVREIVQLSKRHHLELALIDYSGDKYWRKGLLAKAWGRPPAIVLTQAFVYGVWGYPLGWQRKPSPLAIAATAEAGINVLAKSELEKRTLLDAAREAFQCGLMNEARALASLTTVPAETSGYGFRIGKIREGYDADVVVWRHHPLRFGTPPLQAWIDGIPQMRERLPASLGLPIIDSRLQEAPFRTGAHHDAPCAG